METVDILARIDRHEHLVCFDMRGKRQLHQDAVNRLIGVEPADHFQQRLLRSVFSHPDRLAQDTGLRTCSFLVAHIGRTGRIVSDQDDAELRQPFFCFFQILDALPQRFTDIGSDRFSADQFHLALSFT